MAAGFRNAGQTCCYAQIPEAQESKFLDIAGGRVEMVVKQSKLAGRRLEMVVKQSSLMAG